ncbi:hypothetical protein JOD45_000791 [Scopulibacillus daqui]|uniref:YfhE-like protein n=1 Tax=Scopulibacillus daqui TaxID=1469162 RepID=A0ABS2PX31_9BACL|nr:hypothetical protein [Scopulibacillus daqui]MBM7644598.1 hypothetical protein [Scopulibacillus daqui]
MDKKNAFKQSYESDGKMNLTSADAQEKKKKTKDNQEADMFFNATQSSE